MTPTVVFLSIVLLHNALKFVPNGKISNLQSGKCNKSGIFKDETDTTCTKYYSCRQKRNKLLRKDYECPKEMYFDPERRNCSNYFKCTSTEELIKEVVDDNVIKIMNNSSSQKVNLLELELHIDLLDENNESNDDKDNNISEKDNSQKVENKLSTNLLESENLCLSDLDDVNFVCKEKGRFRKADDLNCGKYYLCSVLRNGSILQTEFSCPNSSYFDPEQGICSKYYQCPCISASLTTEIPTTTTEKITTIQTTSTEKVTENPCRVDEDPNFVCAEKGRFKVPNDLTCSKYYLCSQLKNGTVLQNEYSCPLGSYFDEKINICSKYYQCPCISTSPTAEIPTTTTEKITTIQTTSTEKVTENPCRVDEDPNFVCAEKGRFKVPNDLTCSKYYLCSQLKNGTVLQNEYSCPLGSYFDEKINICSKYYQCPCISTSPTAEIPTTTTEKITTIQTTSTEKVTENPCRVDEDPNFVCTEKGRFKVPNDLTCSKYYLCSQLKNGTVLQNEYSCPPGSYFDEKINICSKYYQCPCISTSPTAEIPTTTTEKITTIQTTSTEKVTENPCRVDEDPNFVCAEKGRFKVPNDLTCSKYYLCSQLKNGTVLQNEYSCPLGSYFDEKINICSKYYQCPCISTSSTAEIPTTTTEKITTIQTSTEKVTENPCRVDEDPNFVCAEKGRFKVPNDLTCSKYYLCSQLKNGTVLQNEYSCPPGSYFDEKINICSKYYQCPCISTSPTAEIPTTTTEKITTIQTTSTEKVTENPCRVDEDPNFVCAEKGRFKVPNDLTCSKYYLCSQLKNGTVLQNEYSCPLGSYFDEKINICSKYYQCPCISTSSTAEIPTTTTEKITTIQTTSTEKVTENPCRVDEDPNFVCAEKGRFKVPNDLTCSKYYLCSQLKNGTVLQNEYSCPLGSYFDEKINICSKYYQCPCISTSSTAEIPTTTTEKITTMQTTSTEKVTENPCRVDEDPNFVCAEKGRFKVPNDLTCSKYYLCSQLKNGTVLQNEYSCPPGSFFDEKINICSKYYQCPCISTSPTAEIPTTTTEKITTIQTTSTEKVTENPCRVDEDPNFVCAEKGRFKVPYDLTCSKYYLCSQLKNGTVLQNEYSCPPGSYFDEKITICSKYYQCPCTYPA